VHHAPLNLPRAIQVADGFRMIALACLRHLTLNEVALAQGDAESVHQMRVAARRLRAAISLFGPLLEDGESQAIKQQLRWLQQQLGPTREYDVLIRDTAALKNDDASENAEAFAELLATLRERRAVELARAQQAVASERYRQLVLDTTRWLIGGRWLSTADKAARRRRQKSLMPWSRRILQQRRRHLQKRLAKLSRLAPQERHALRISVKKLHYGMQFFASLFAERSARRKAFVKVLEQLQAQLGSLNDARTHESLAHALLRSSLPSGEPQLNGEQAFALGLVNGRANAKIPKLLRHAKRSGRRLAKLPRLWD